jgi:hypothetical protein
MTDYKQPRRLNSVTLVLLLALAAAVYWFWRFFPAHFDGWTVDHILKESAAAIYRVNRLREPERTQELRALVDKVRADIQSKASVKDPNLEVNLNIDGNEASMSAEYNVVITHPFITRTTTLHFLKKQTADIKTVTWE